MGYSTDFAGTLKFTKELTTKQLAKVKSFLGEDCRQHPEWGQQGLSYIDLAFNSDFSGLQWDGSEKTYLLEEKVNVIIREMQKEYPEFGLEGFLIAQGESFDDRWKLIIENGQAVKREIILTGAKIKCPHCNKEFIAEQE